MNDIYSDGTGTARLTGGQNPLDFLLPAVEKDTATWRWGTVTQADPLRVKLDGDDAALLVTPQDMNGPRQVNDRVYCQINARRITVLGPKSSTFAKTIVINEAGNATATSTGHGLTIQSGAFALKIGDDNIDAYNPVAGTGRTLFLNQNSDGAVAVGNNVPITAAKSVTTKEYVDNAIADAQAATSVSNFLTAASGWSITSFSAFRSARVMNLAIGVQRTGADIPGGSSGNITNSTIATFSTFLPRASLMPFAVTSTGFLYGGYVSSAGNIALAAIPPNQNIVTGNGFTIAMSWIF